MNIFVFGDSITEGFYDTECGGWCSRLIQDLMQKEVESGHTNNKHAVNFGIAGDTSEDVLARLTASLETRISSPNTPTDDFLLLAVGVNDSQYDIQTGENRISIDATITNLEKIISTARQYLKTIVIVGIAPVYETRVQPMPWKVTHGYGNEVINKYNAALQQLATTSGIRFIDMDSVYQNRESDFLPDGIHPNAAGHELIFQKVKEALVEESII